MKTLRRGLTVLSSAAILTGIDAGQAQAAWSFTRWGMPKEQVESLATTMKVEWHADSPDKLRMKSVVDGVPTAFELEFVNGGLASVTGYIRTREGCVKLRAALEVAYGPTTYVDIPGAGMRWGQWNDATSENTVHAFLSPDSCKVSYSELSRLPPGLVSF